MIYYIYNLKINRFLQFTIDGFHASPRLQDACPFNGRENADNTFKYLGLNDDSDWLVIDESMSKIIDCMNS